jgi:hypothetical protein
MIPVQESTLSYTVTNIVDVALDAMRDRSAMVSAQDVTDLLLDLRSSLRRTVLLEEAAAASGRERQPRNAWSAAAARAARLGSAGRTSQLPRPFRSRAI